VGACVGVKGSRVQMIVRELENEKIDIVPFNPNPRLFITSALVPAQVQSVNLDEEQKKATVTVKKGNLSLAIGKRGQNARLAANLTGWKLEIHSEAEEPRVAPSESENQSKYLEDFLSQVDGWPDHLTEVLVASPFNTVAALADADFDELVNVLEGDQELASTLIQDARSFEESYHEMIESYREMTQTQYGDESKAEGEPVEGEAQPEPAAEEAAPAEEESSEKQQ
jgi:N utilization substance protein A